MIGKYARGFRHLKRCVGNTKVKKIFIVQNGRILQCEAFVTDSKNRKGKALYLFQNMGGDNDLSKFSSDDRDLAATLLSRYGRYYVPIDQQHLNQFGKRCFMVNDNFDEEYESFQKKNKKLLEQVYGKYCYPYDAMACFMFALIGNIPNLYVWALKNYYNNHITLATIENIIKWNQKYNQLVGKLSKGTITAYNGRDGINNLMEEIVKLRKNKRANDSINLFNTTQKKLLKKLELDEKKINILNRFGRLSNVKKHNFVRKMSTVEDVNDIMHQMSFLSNIHFEWNKESLLEYIHNTESIDCEIVLDVDNIVLVKVNTYDTVKSLAKTTNWCISKNKRYWNDYVGFNSKAIQFVLFDFSKPEDHELSIVGFTTKKNIGITNAHSYSNNNLMGCGGTPYRQLKSFLDNSSTRNIYSIIKGHKIPLSKILNINLKHYEWNLKSFITFLNYCMSEDDYNIHFCDEEEGFLVLSTKHENVRFLIGDTFKKDFISIKGFEYFLFFDFTRDVDDCNRLTYAIINRNKKTQEEYCEEIFDAFGQNSQYSFDELLESYGLPYDTICRTNDKMERFSTAFRNYDLSTIKQFINDDEILEKIKNDKKQEFKQSTYNALYETIFSFRSFDYINVIYDNGKTLVDFIGERNLGDLVSVLVNEIAYNFRAMGKIPEGTKFEEIVEGITDNRKKSWLGLYCIFNMIMEHESSKIMLNKLIEIFPNISHHQILDEFFLTFILEKLNFKVLNRTTDYYLKRIANICSEKINKILLEKEMCEECKTLFFNSLPTFAPYYSDFKEKFGIKEEKTVEVNKNSSSTYSFSFSDLLSSYLTSTTF